MAPRECRRWELDITGAQLKTEDPPTFDRDSLTIDSLVAVWQRLKPCLPRVYIGFSRFVEDDDAFYRLVDCDEAIVYAAHERHRSRLLSLPGISDLRDMSPELSRRVFGFYR